MHGGSRGAVQHTPKAFSQASRRPRAHLHPHPRPRSFWPAANLVTFTLDPSRRVAFLGVAGIAWNSLLSYLNSSPQAAQAQPQTQTQPQAQPKAGKRG